MLDETDNKLIVVWEYHHEVYVYNIEPETLEIELFSQASEADYDFYDLNFNVSYDAQYNSVIYGLYELYIFQQIDYTTGLFKMLFTGGISIGSLGGRNILV